MCNLLRYKEEIQEATGVFEEFSHTRIVPKVRYRVPPSEAAPVLRLGADGRAQIDMLHFGFRAGKGRQLMARGETVAEKDMWAGAFRKRRCLVLAHGFYDSEVITKSVSQPWHFHLKGDNLMVMAAVWEEAPDEGNFAIVSAPANQVVARVIDRMPVILRQESWRKWLDPQAKPEELQPLLQTYEPSEMEGWRVTRKVNRRGFDNPECIAPLTEVQDDLGLF